MKKKIIITMLICFFCNNIYSFVYKYLETIRIENHTNQVIYVKYELNPEKTTDYENNFFYLIIEGKVFGVEDNLHNHKITRIQSLHNQKILEYNYVTEESYRTMDLEAVDSIPFLDKLKAVYSIFEITNEEGDILFSLDNAELTLVKKFKFDNTNAYSLVICNDDHYIKGEISDEEKNSQVEFNSESIVGIKAASDW